MNNDLKIAKETLESESLTICAIKNDKVVYKSKIKGIAPLYKAYEDTISFSGCSVADKVIGLGAAYLYKKLDAKHVYTNIISKIALEYLHSNNIDVEYNVVAEKILNREKNGFCPVESMAIKSESFDEFVDYVKNFLLSINLI